MKAVLSLGGWTGSRFFSIAINSKANRTKFVKAVINLALKYKLDGLDFECVTSIPSRCTVVLILLSISWEYPNGLGVGCNIFSPQDTSNYLLFLQELRAHPVGKLLIVTAAVGHTPWLGKDGNPLGDVSAFADVFDYIAIMNYDIWGPWSPTVGPNAPLDDSCAANRAGSATSAVKTWKKAGMPSDRIVLGIAAYGHSFRVRKGAAFVGGPNGQLALFPSFDPKDEPAGDKWDDEAGTVDVCGVKSQQPGGTIQFWGMISFGYLKKDGTQKSGKHHIFDSCSKTVSFLFDARPVLHKQSSLLYMTWRKRSWCRMMTPSYVLSIPFMKGHTLMPS